jgi:uncharacterized protein (DUF1499 family)
MNYFKGMFILMIVLAISIDGCTSPKQKRHLNGKGSLPDCPNRPNCVSSKALDAKHLVKPFQIKRGSISGWTAIRKVLGNLPRTTVVTFTDQYIHAECKSRLFRFIDDLELLLDPKTGVIAIRSASRIGYSDLGVNRRRVETLRQKLSENGIIL